MDQQKKVWTLKELAEAANVDPSYLRHLLKAGKLKGYKQSFIWFIEGEEASHWLAQRKQKE